MGINVRTVQVKATINRLSSKWTLIPMSISIRTRHRIKQSGFAYAFLLRQLDGVPLDQANNHTLYPMTSASRMAELISRGTFVQALREVRDWCSTNVGRYRVQETSERSYPICILLNTEKDCFHTKIRFDDGQTLFIENLK